MFQNNTYWQYGMIDFLRKLCLLKYFEFPKFHCVQALLALFNRLLFLPIPLFSSQFWIFTSNCFLGFVRYRWVGRSSGSFNSLILEIKEVVFKYYFKTAVRFSSYSDALLFIYNHNLTCFIFNIAITIENLQWSFV